MQRLLELKIYHQQATMQDVMDAAAAIKSALVWCWGRGGLIFPPLVMRLLTCTAELTTWELTF